MGHSRLSLAVVTAALTFAVAVVRAFAIPPEDVAAQRSSDRVVIKLRETAEPSAHGARALTAAEWTRRLGLPPGIALHSMRRPPANVTADDAVPDLSRPAVLHLNGKATVAEALARLQHHADIEFAEPDYVSTGGARPSDPNYSLQWHHQKIQSEAAWNISTGSSDVLVAVLDTGVNVGLAEFFDRLVPGHDYVNNDAIPADDYGHGTAVTGVLAANANNNWLVAGVNWRCRIVPEKVLDSSNHGFYSWWDQAIYDATDAGAKVINLSAGGSSDSAATVAAIDYAISHGVIFVTITGNDSAGTIQFPGRLPQCITVGATERDDTRASFSNYGPAIDLVAPGRDIYTVGKDGGLEYWYGTSFAAPQVAAVAAIVAGLDPTITQQKMEKLLCATAQDGVGGASDTPGWDQYFGYGRLNARNAVQLAATRSAPPQPLNLSSRMRVDTGDKAMIGGFIITGAHAKYTMVRAIGPSLAAAGIGGTLDDPVLTLTNANGTIVGGNNNWGDSQRGEIEATGLAPTDARESALARILQPGSYTALVRSADGRPGVGLVEVYDLQATPNSKLANVSTRGSVETADNVIIGGFIVGAPSNYVVRAIGPSLQNAGVAGSLGDPTLELRDANGVLIAANDNWASDPNAASVQASGLAPQDSRESAVYRAFAGGNYTAVVRGVNDTTGVGLVEVYNVP
jgi:hypothetical protein